MQEDVVILLFFFLEKGKNCHSCSGVQILAPLLDGGIHWTSYLTSVFYFLFYKMEINFYLFYVATMSIQRVNLYNSSAQQIINIK